MKLVTVFALFCILGLLVLPFAHSVTAQSDDVSVESDLPEATSDYEEELPTDDGPAEDLKSTFLFVEPSTAFAATPAIPAGAIVRGLIGLSNIGDKDYFVHAVAGSFRYPSDLSYHVQNFTTTEYNVTIRATTQASLEYVFRPDPDYDPRKFVLVISVLYYDVSTGRAFIDSVYNSTIDITEPNEPFQAETFFLYLTLVAIVGLSAFFASKAFGGSGKKKSTRSSSSVSTEHGTGKSSSADDEWLKGVLNEQKVGKAKRH